MKRFLADAMLERLARWLRVLGHDVISAGALHDDEIARRAVSGDCVLLTRDKRLARSEQVAGNCLLIQSSAPLEQLREVIAPYGDVHGLEASPELFTRCLLCNTLLNPIVISREDVRVPTTVRERSAPVHECPSCGRVYWES